MKKLMVLTLIAGTVLTGQVAFAESLEDVLKEKGVITEQDYGRVTKSGPVDYKPGGGFAFTSADEKYKAALGSILQLRYTLLDYDSANDKTAAQALDSSKFELRRIKLFLSGYAYAKDLTYKLQLNFANIQGGVVNNGGLLEETFLNYRLRDELQIRFGQDKVQFGRQFITSSGLQGFVDKSVVTNAFTPGYDTGIQLHGKVAGGLVNYNVAGFGGVGQDTFRTTSDNAFAARVTINPLGDVKYSESDVEYSEKPLLSVATDFYLNTIYSGETNNLGFAGSKGWYGIGNPLQPTARKFSAGEAIDFNTLGLDAAFKWRGLFVQSEYFIGQADGQSSGNTLRAQGFYAQTGYFVLSKQLELAVRYGYIDPNRDVAKDHWSETTGAVSWYINSHNLKLQADYTRLHKQTAIAFNKGPNATNDDQVRVQAQLLF